MPALMGYDLRKLLPDGVSAATDLVDLSSGHDYSGTGGIARNEAINLRLAAVVIQVLPNGNLVVAGRQEIRVNYELREMHVSGVIRS